jgi:hypothetical protein
VEALMPEAVRLDADGFKRVDYAMLGLDGGTMRVR